MYPQNITVRSFLFMIYANCGAIAVITSTTYMTIVELFDEYSAPYSPKVTRSFIDHDTNIYIEWHNIIHGNRKEHQSLLLIMYAQKNYSLLRHKHRTCKFASFRLCVTFLATVATDSLSFATGGRFCNISLWFASRLRLRWMWASKVHVCWTHTKGTYFFIKVPPSFEIHSC